MKGRILHVIDSLALGGAEKLLVSMINGLQDYEHHVMVLRGPDTLRHEITVPYNYINLNCPSIRQVFFRVGRARKYIQENKIDLVHSHLYESNLLARLATPSSIKLINSIHAVSSLASYTINRLTLFIEKISYKKRHVIIGVSKTVLDDFDKWVGLKGKNYVLYNFVEDKFWRDQIERQQPDGILKMVAVGNLRHQKNYPYLLKAFKKLSPNVQLDIYGHGYMEEELHSEIKKNNLNVRLMGMSNSIEKVLPLYDVYVMSSFFEGQPLSLLEASASRLPSLLADIPVLKEVLQEDAIYFDINDTASFEKSVREILDGKKDLPSLSSKAFERVSSFARRNTYLEKLNSIYQDNLH